MRFPSSEEIEAADCIQLARWHRFLRLPVSIKYKEGRGKGKISDEEFEMIKLDHERWGKMINRIEERFAESGGMTPEISKLIGWEE